MIRLNSFLDTPHAQQQPLDPDLMQVFIVASMSSMSDKDPQSVDYVNPAAGDRALEPITQSMGFQILLSRLKPYGVKVSLWTVLFLAAACKTPGDAVLWAYTLTHMAKRNPGAIITIGKWTDAFPMGLPNEEAKRAVWDAQKAHGNRHPGAATGRTDNLLDNHNWMELLPE